MEGFTDIAPPNKFFNEKMVYPDSSFRSTVSFFTHGVFLRFGPPNDCVKLSRFVPETALCYNILHRVGSPAILNGPSRDIEGGISIAACI